MKSGTNIWNAVNIGKIKIIYVNFSVLSWFTLFEFFWLEIKVEMWKYCYLFWTRLVLHC